jgi:CDP-diglyceride synthetase
MNEPSLAHTLKSRRLWSQPYSYLVFLIFPALIVTVWFSPRWVAQTVVIALIAWAAWEASMLTGFKKVPLRLIYVGGTLSLIWGTEIILKYLEARYSYSVAPHEIFYSIPIYLLIISILFLIWAVVAILSYAGGGSALEFQYIGIRAVFGVLALLANGFFAMKLTTKPWGPHAAVAGLALLWSLAAGSYLGQYYGKRKRWKRLDPTKTSTSFWVSLAFFIITIISTLTVNNFLDTDSEWISLIPLLIIFGIPLLFVGLVAYVGDLLGRMFKRLTVKEAEATPVQPSFYVNGLLAGLSLFSMCLSMASWIGGS